jgi:transposase
MPAERVAMRHVREIIRLKSTGVSGHEIARRVGVAPSTVRLTLQRLAAAGLGGPLPAEVTDAALEARLFTTVGTKQGHRRQPEPDWARLHRELKRKHVTLALLWDEYIEEQPQGYRYSRFCELYRNWERQLSVTMRQTHVGGDKLFVDYAGDTMPVIVDRLTGETRPAQVFVAVMGASNFTYAEASWTQGLADWIGAHTRAFAAIGGVPNLVVPDNTKVAVIKACLYEPQVNRSYTEMAAHYKCAVLPARPRRPRDKAKVEAGVLIIERWLLGRLRHRRFYGLTELNNTISDLLKQLNDQRVLRRLGATRRQLLEELDRPNLKPLPSEPYVLAEWRLRRVGIDYHVELDNHFYSVPYRFARAEVEARLTARTVEIFLKGERIAAHLRASGNGRHTTVPEHMPSSHRRYAGWTIARIRQDAARIGPATAALCEQILEHRPHPEQGFRACLGIVRLVRPFGAARLDAACARAIDIGTLSYRSVRSILDHKLDRHDAPKSAADSAPILHANIRGPRYYH